MKVEAYLECTARDEITLDVSIERIGTLKALEFKSSIPAEGPEVEAGPIETTLLFIVTDIVGVFGTGELFGIKPSELGNVRNSLRRVLGREVHIQ